MAVVGSTMADEAGRRRLRNVPARQAAAAAFQAEKDPTARTPTRPATSQSLF